jgi:hypothetical protein
VHLASAALDEDALGRNPPTFLSLDFFEHETQATPVVSSSAPEYDHTIQVSPPSSIELPSLSRLAQRVWLSCVAASVAVCGQGGHLFH